MSGVREKSDFHVCWTMDCESCRREINDTALGRRAIEGFCSILEESGFKATLFLMPEEIGHMPDLLSRVSAEGHELALHLHPDESGYPRGEMGFYSRDQQEEILDKAIGSFQRVLGMRPVSARTGFGSANDSTFPALAGKGFRQSSNSFPGRRMSAIASNWAGAPLFSHYAHAHNRFLEGDLDLVEIPMSVDWETMIWGGIHPQDLRVEYTDARNHSFAIRKIMNRQAGEGLPLKALVPLTHNIFDYSDPANFRRQTLEGMIRCVVECANELGVPLRGSTLSEAGAAFRKAAPREMK